MSATNAFELALLAHYFNNSNHANIGDATGLRSSSTAGSVYISLHTADPGETGTQSTSETAYTSYARVAVARSSSGWTVSSNPMVNAATVTFPTCTGSAGSQITHFGIGTDPTGTGNLLLTGALTTAYQPANGNAPSFAAGEISLSID